MPSHRTNFENMMLEMQHDQVMSDLKKIPQEISEALYKCKELSKENQLYWWVTISVITPALGTEYICQSLTFKQSKGLVLYCLPFNRKLASLKERL